MQLILGKNIKYLYRYENPDGSITITLNPRQETDLVHSYRLIADEGYELYYLEENQHTSVLDVNTFIGWTQEEIVVEPETDTLESIEQEDY